MKVLQGAVIMRFRKRNALVEAVQWFREGDDARVEHRNGTWAIATPEGWREVRSGDWIVVDDAGNARPMDPRLFASLYEPV